ncbi:MAG: PAS domain S-box protein, partial [Deltaproteobacteria bacterium]
FSAIIFLWIIFGSFLKFSFLLLTIPTFTFVGLIYIATGASFLRSGKIKGFGATVTGYAFIVWGIHKMNYPFLRPVAWFAPWGYLLASLLEIIISLGILLTYFQKNKEELKQALGELELNEKILNKAQEIAHIGSWHLDLKKKSLSWSDETYRIFGLIPQAFSVTYEAFLEKVHPQDREMVERTYANAINNKIPYDCIHRIVRPDGEVRIVQEKSDDVVDASGETIHSYGMIHDITERKLIEEKFLQSHARFEAIFNSITDAIVFVDLERHIVMINPAFTATFGYGLEEVSGKTSKMLYANPEDYLVQGRERYHEAAKVVAPICEIEYRRKDGTVFPSETLGVPVNDFNGETIGFLAVIRDVSERREAEKERKRLERQWRQSQKLEAIGTLAGGIAHDFNNILAVILGYAGLAREEARQGSDLADYLDKILQATHRSKDLVKQILAFSSQARIERAPLRPQPIIKEALKMLRASIPTTIEIQENISEDCGTIDADPTQLHQVLMNLCTNAFHAMEEKGGILRVELKIADSPPAEIVGVTPDTKKIFLELSVSDTGQGIGPDTITKIFDPFFTTKVKGKGTGLGLAIVYGIVQEYGGTVTVESQLGKGTTFHVYLPQSRRGAIPSSLERATVQTGRERILFIDDEELLADLGKEMLERLGYRVTVKTNSLEAMETFRNQADAFDLVITDQTMPGLTGIELATRMLQIRPELPIILCTGYSNLVNEHVAREQGIKEFALKPITQTTIAQLIRKALGEKAETAGQ